MKNETPTLEEKVKQYEDFLHNINLMFTCGNDQGLQRLLRNADNWSYAHRVGNGEYSEEQQQQFIDRAFWALNKY
jgi:UDP-N-acetylmuramate-alanine ligase